MYILCETYIFFGPKNVEVFMTCFYKSLMIIKGGITLNRKIKNPVISFILF